MGQEGTQEALFLLTLDQLKICQPPPTLNAAQRNENSFKENNHFPRKTVFGYFNHLTKKKLEQIISFKFVFDMRRDLDTNVHLKNYWLITQAFPFTLRSTELIHTFFTIYTVCVVSITTIVPSYTFKRSHLYLEKLNENAQKMCHFCKRYVL